MPTHDWSTSSDGAFHNFHQYWSIELCKSLNGGLLPPGFYAMADQRVDGNVPDVITFQTHGQRGDTGGIALTDAPPKLKRLSRTAHREATDRQVYAQRANRIAVQTELGQVVAILEIVSPGNKDSRHALHSFTSKVVDYIQRGVNVGLVDLFPPTPRDPNGIHQEIWNDLEGDTTIERPSQSPVTVASYTIHDDIDAYVDYVAFSDPLPDLPIFIAPGRYINVPLEITYQASWQLMPEPIRERIVVV